MSAQLAFGSRAGFGPEDFAAFDAACPTAGQFHAEACPDGPHACTRPPSQEEISGFCAEFETVPECTNNALAQEVGPTVCSADEKAVGEMEEEFQFDTHEGAAIYAEQDSWADHFPDCGGDNQSPINLFTGVGDGTPATAHATLLAGGKNPAQTILFNNGLFLAVDFGLGVDGPSIGFQSPGPRGLFNGPAFAIAGALFSPSNHVIEGKHFDIEFSVPMFRPLGNDGQSPPFWVASFLFSAEDDIENSGFEAAIGAFPTVGHHLNLGEVDWNSVFSHLVTDSRFYSYVGSIPFPPCHEGVGWMIFEDVIPISKRQLARFNKFFRGNNRDPQRLNGRVSHLNGPSPFSSPFPDLTVTYEYPQ